MSAPHVARVLTDIIRQIGRSNPRHVSLTISRAASSKHPNGFVPPAAEDLTELRERVQDFTSEPLFKGTKSRH